MQSLETSAESVNTTPTTRSFLTRNWTRNTDRGRPQIAGSKDQPKGPLGLTTVYHPDENTHVVADLIFVHGLNGGSRSTWTKGDVANFWPQEWLAKDTAMADVRIHTFGYPSGISRESVLNVRDFARSLLAAVKDTPCIAQAPKVISCAPTTS